MNPAH